MKHLSLKFIVTKLENAIITLSGPAIAISGIIAGIDLLTGGSMFKTVSWLSLTWAICLLLTLDFQVLMLGARAKQIYNGGKEGRKKFFEIVAIVAIAASISYVSVQMQSIIARSQTTVTGRDGQPHTISIDQATRDMGINPIALIWERSSLVLILIFMSGWLGDEQGNGGGQQATVPVQPHIVIDYAKLAEAIIAMQQPHTDPALLAAGNRQVKETGNGERSDISQERIRDGQERPDALMYTIAESSPSPAQNGSIEALDPMVVFSEEQRRKILEAADQGKSLRAIPEYAGIGKGRPRYQAMKLWLRMSKEAQKA